MPSANQTISVLSKGFLYQLIAMNQSPLSRVAMAKIFGDDRKTSKQIDVLLNELANGEQIIQEGKRGYRAIKPWADIAYATVGSAPGKKRIPVQILNMPPNINLNVTMSRSDFHKFKLKKGRQIVVGLQRGSRNDPGLQARFIDHAEEGQPFQLKGIFNEKSGAFLAADTTIKTAFKLAQAPAIIDDPQRHMMAELPMQFDIRSPLISIVDDPTRSHIVASKYGIVTGHPEHVLKEAELLSRTIVNYDQRTDLRDLHFVTVDPLGARDLDDAFCAEQGKDGYTLYTAIADVASLVPYGSIVDREAYHRGITFYLANNHTAHMLPSVLSTSKSSLVPNEDRPAIVVKQSLDKNGVLKDFHVFAAVIRSREQLSYGQFYDLLERNTPRFEAIDEIHRLRRHRSWNPTLDSFLKNSADSFTTKSIIETLMVQTNSLIAQFLKAANIPFLSRNFAANGSDEAKKGGLTQRAYYASYQLGHASLGLKHYAHVTSPIRRYADIVNQRAVHKALGTLQTGISADEISRLDEIAAHLNDRRNLDHDVMNAIQKYHTMPDMPALQP